MAREEYGRADPPEYGGKKNRLGYEKSPYLLQHSNNPVDWYPWGSEAFVRAAREDKPVFLSIGYATCHWCHVMAHESFEDPEVAELLNRNFISVKVDREERPDIDSVYMSVCQQMTGQGGWPLTLIMTPDKKAFFAATYIPKETRFSQRGLLFLLPRISSLWKEQRQKLIQSADDVLAAISPTSPRCMKNEPGGELLDDGYTSLLRQFDPVNGGFGNAPKFPTPHTLLFLIRYATRHRDSRAREMAEKTFDAIHDGGIYDHVGGGVHRYSTDIQWHVPHFEKMLYDQALLLMASAELFQLTHKETYRKTAEDIVGYVMRDLCSGEGAFFSAEDADSPEGEGAFYVWTMQEFISILGTDDASLAARMFGVTKGGNYRDPERGEGYNILSRRQISNDSKELPGRSDSEIASRLESIHTRLSAARTTRVRPSLDDKILADWNGLFIAALARAGWIFSNETWCEAAKTAMQFILTRMRNEENGLLHRYRDGESAISGFADDYAFVIHALIELFETTFDVQYLSAALELNEYFTDHFWDKPDGGFFTVADHGEPLIIRKKEIYDGAIPSCNSVAFTNLIRLSRLTGNAILEVQASALSRSVAGIVSQSPSAYCWFLCGHFLVTGPSQEVVIVGEPKNPDTQALLSVVRSLFIPAATILQIAPGISDAALADIAPFTRNLTRTEGKATAYICSGNACSLPVTDPDAMRALLAG